MDVYKDLFEEQRIKNNVDRCLYFYVKAPGSLFQEYQDMCKFYSDEQYNYFSYDPTYESIR